MPTIAETLAQARRCHETGELGRAEALYRQILETDPVNAEVIFHLGSLAQGSGNLDAAAGHFRQVLQLLPDCAPAHNELGNTLFRQGMPAEAVEHYRQTIRLQPRFAGAYFNLGNVLRELGEWQSAADALRHCLVRQPQFPGAHYTLGVVLERLERLQEAAAHYQAALRQKPDYAEAHNNLGTILQTLGHLDEAVVHYEHAVRARPGYVEANFNLGNCALEKGRLDLSILYFHRALEINPDYAPAHNNLAEAYLERHEPDHAEKHFRETLRIDPRSTITLLNLAVYGFYTPADPSIAQLQTWLADESFSAESGAQLHFAIAQLLERQGDRDSAFEHYAEGNALRRRWHQQKGTAHDPVEFAQRIDRLIETFCGDYFRRVEGYGTRSELPVFIVGMPRSGTTLVEQILSQHPKVAGAGELSDMNRIVAELPTTLRSAEQFPECMPRIDSATVHLVAESHLRRLAQLGGPAERVIDKLPLNFLNLGLIATLLPRARVIHCRRDPRDVCVSCFCQYFKDLKFCWDLEELGRYYRDYERLMAHWGAVLPIRMTEVRYEELVADPGPVSRRLVDFCGLDWDEACLRFYENRRPVRTASKLQVRRPMYTKSVGRWEMHRARLEPLLRALGTLG